MFPAFFRECESLKKTENGKKKSAKMKFGEKKERKRISVVDTNTAGKTAVFIYAFRQFCSKSKTGNHPLCGCASVVTPKNSPKWYNKVFKS